MAAAMPARPPTLTAADDSRVSNADKCGFVYGDPHVFSWDGEAVDCRMGEGDYLYAKSTTTPFEVQVRHVAPPWEESLKNFQEKGWYIGTGAQAVVINTGVHGEPEIEINAFTEGATSGGHCSMDYYFDGVKTDLPADTTIHGVSFERRSSEDQNIWDEDHFYWHHYRNFYFEKSGVFVQITKKYWDMYGCFMNIRICLPDEIRNQDLYGLFGNANGNPDDDFRDKDGNVLATKPRWGARDDWCNANWCIADDASNKFQEPSKVHECAGHSSDAIDEAVKQASPLLKEMCNDDPSCIFDAIVSGSTTSGLQTLVDQQGNNGPPKVIDPSFFDDQETDFCTTPEGHDVDCQAYEFSYMCENIGYDFGYKMNGCTAATNSPFQGLTLTDHSPTCEMGNYNYGHYDMSCDADGMEATITPKVDGVVKVSGSTTGMLYTGLTAGKTYTLTTGPYTKKETIVDMEFCFKCPTSVSGGNVISCAADVKVCGWGTELSRDPANDCKFPACHNPAAESQTSGSCSAMLSLTGPESIHLDSNRPYHVTGTMRYDSPPANKDVKLFIQNPNGDDELLGSSTMLLQQGAQVGVPIAENFSLRCVGNNLVGPNGPSPLGANGQEVEIYAVGPCGMTNLLTTVCRSDAGGGANGDPHVKTWRQKHFDFNGRCDLILLKSENFHNGLGMDVHIRTKERKDMSYIANAAVRIGSDILEVASKGIYAINGVLSPTMPATLAGFPVTYKYVEKSHQHVFELSLGGHQKMLIKVYRDFVSVLMDAATPDDFGGSVGLMGDFNTGLLIARDGATTMEDINEFGSEWQVTDEEPKLFMEKDRFPQYPVKCVMPDASAESRRRRLAETDPEFHAAAVKACAQYEGDAKDDCIFDLMTTGDLAMADAGSY